MNDLAMTLARPLGRPVLDATGLKGRYDIRGGTSSLMAPATADGSEPTPADPVGIMIMALREQMGLKVEGRKDMIDVLVVEHAGKTPIEN